MIVDATELREMAASVGARLGVSPNVRDAALRASVREAEVLAEDTYEAPAALVYALGRNASAFAAFAPMIFAAAELQAHMSCVRLGADEADVVTLARAVTRGEKSYEDVRAFFAATVLPFAG